MSVRVGKVKISSWLVRKKRMSDLNSQNSRIVTERTKNSH